MMKEPKPPSGKARPQDSDDNAEEVVDELLDITAVIADGVDAADLKLRPTGRVFVNATVVITDIPHITDDKDRAEFQGQLVLQWADPRLKLPEGLDRMQIRDSDVWAPQVDYYNVIGAVAVPATKTALLQNADETYVVHTQRFFGAFASRTDGTYYPFDLQLLPLVIEAFGNPSDAVAFDPDHYKGLLSHVPSNKDAFHVDGTRTRISEERKVTGRSYSRLSVSVLVRRKWVNKIFPCYAPVTILLTLICFSVYMDPAAVPARTALTIISLLSSVVVFRNLANGTPGFGWTDALGVWVIFCAAGAVAIFVRVHWLRQTEDVAWKKKMESMAEDYSKNQDDEPKENSTKKMLRKLGLFGRDSDPPSKRVDEVARKYLPLIFAVEAFLIICPAIGALTHDYGGTVPQIG